MGRAWASRIVLAVVLAALAYAVLVALTDGDALWDAFGRIGARAFLLAAALTTAGYVLKALRWRLYLHALGVPLAFPRAITMGLANGKSGQIVKSYYLWRDAAVPYQTSIPATVAERVADTASVVLLLLVGIALVPGADPLAAFIVLALLGALLWVARQERAGEWLAALVMRVRLVSRHGPAVRNAHARLRAHLHARRLAAPAVIGLAGYLFEALALDLLAGGALGFGHAALIVALADLAGVATLVPGGIGVAEGSLVALLLLKGIPLADAAAITLLFRACTLWLSLALGAGAAGVLHVTAAKPAKG